MEKMSKIKLISLIAGICAGLIPLLGTGLLWAADQRYVTQKSLTLYDLKQLDRDIRKLELKVRLGEATTLEEALLQDMKTEKEQIERELAND